MTQFSHFHIFKKKKKKKYLYLPLPSEKYDDSHVALYNKTFFLLITLLFFLHKENSIIQ